MLQNDYLVAKIGVDTAENEPRKEWCVGRDGGRGGGRGVGKNMDKNIDGGGKIGEFPSPLPYIGSKWSRTDVDSYFEHKIVKHRFWLLLRT